MIQMKVGKGILVQEFSILELFYSMYRNGFAQYNLAGFGTELHFYGSSVIRL